jgi:hypothetical protein
MTKINQVNISMRAIQTALTSILLVISLIVTYSTVVVSGTILAIGSAVNYPILYIIGWLSNGRQEI